MANKQNKVKFQIKGTVFHKTALSSVTGPKFGGSKATHTSDQSATNLGVLVTLGFDNPLEWHTTQEGTTPMTVVFE